MVSRVGVGDRRGNTQFVAVMGRVEQFAIQSQQTPWQKPVVVQLLLFFCFLLVFFCDFYPI